MTPRRLAIAALVTALTALGAVLAGRKGAAHRILGRRGVRVGEQVVGGGFLGGEA